MLKRYVLPLVLIFLFTGCIERGMPVPTSKTRPNTLVVTDHNMTNIQKNTKTVSPASSIVIPIEKDEKPTNEFLNTLQNNIAGTLVIVIAAILVL